uniref:Uncharacterized protein n=1 Tax=Arundo donax TaxID=35708 RepID=A0A0A9FQE7_ARUDO
MHIEKIARVTILSTTKIIHLYSRPTIVNYYNYCSFNKCACHNY